MSQYNDDEGLGCFFSGLFGIIGFAWFRILGSFWWALIATIFTLLLVSLVYLLCQEN